MNKYEILNNQFDYVYDEECAVCLTGLNSKKATKCFIMNKVFYFCSTTHLKQMLENNGMKLSDIDTDNIDIDNIKIEKS